MLLYCGVCLSATPLPDDYVPINPYRTFLPPPQLSPYDSLFRRVALNEGLDWRFLVAVSYYESRFDPDARSPMNALGLMQVRPVVARHFGIPASRILDPETNITLAARLIKNIEASLNLPSKTPEYNRLSLILAAYNVGDSRLATARRLTVAYGRDPNNWLQVAQMLNSHQTNAFARQVLTLYRHYKQITL